jgi:hypothetical protein
MISVLWENVAEGFGLFGWSKMFAGFQEYFRGGIPPLAFA